jgi:hypothetical protein
MSIINCSEINQSINELTLAFQDCNKIKNSDLRKLLDVVSAINTCSNGGTICTSQITYDDGNGATTLSGTC